MSWPACMVVEALGDFMGHGFPRGRRRRLSGAWLRRRALAAARMGLCLVSRRVAPQNGSSDLAATAVIRRKTYTQRCAVERGSAPLSLAAATAVLAACKTLARQARVLRWAGRIKGGQGSVQSRPLLPLVAPGIDAQSLVVGPNSQNKAGQERKLAEGNGGFIQAFAWMNNQTASTRNDAAA